jgi:hypothetical protein
MEGTARFPRTDDDRSVGELVNQLSQQTSTLIRQELRLAQTELQEKGKRVGIGAGMFGGAGILALLGRKQVERGTPPLPQQAIEIAKRDVDEIARSASARA